MIYVFAFIDEAVSTERSRPGSRAGYAKAMREAAQQPERDAAARRYTSAYRR